METSQDKLVLSTSLTSGFDKPSHGFHWRSSCQAFFRQNPVKKIKINVGRCHIQRIQSTPHSQDLKKTHVTQLDDNRLGSSEAHRSFMYLYEKSRWQKFFNRQINSVVNLPFYQAIFTIFDNIWWPVNLNEDLVVEKMGEVPLHLQRSPNTVPLMQNLCYLSN